NWALPQVSRFYITPEDAAFDAASRSIYDTLLRLCRACVRYCTSFARSLRQFWFRHGKLRKWTAKLVTSIFIAFSPSYLLFGKTKKDSSSGKNKPWIGQPS